jgi:uncharacterized membrane protein YdjX (TVP38/TMEM64 family)
MTTEARTPEETVLEESRRAQQYIQLWQWRARLEYLILVLVGLFAVTIAAGFIMLDIGERDIRGGWGYPALWIISGLRASSVLLPIPGSGLTIAAGAIMQPLWGIPVPIAVGLTAGSAESLGEFTGYVAGRNGGNLMQNRRIYRLISEWIRRRAFLTMLVMAFMPSPVFDVAGLAAGAARIPIRVFYPAILIGKIVRATVMAAAGYYASGIVVDIVRVMELEGVRSLLDSAQGRILVGVGILVVIALGIYLARRFRAPLSRLW